MIGANEAIPKAFYEQSDIPQCNLKPDDPNPSLKNYVRNLIKYQPGKGTTLTLLLIEVFLKEAALKRVIHSLTCLNRMLLSTPFRLV